jgi:hypothetical protein
MNRINRDTVIAVVLMAVAMLFYRETYNIPNFGYASIGSEVWPRVVLVPLFLLCAIYLVQSLRRREPQPSAGGGVIGFLYRYRNPIGSFAIFFVFLLTIDWLGMLLGGIALVFALLTLLGHRTPKAIALHAAIAVVSVGAMWSLFTYVLRVYLPQGEILQLY